MRIANLVEFVQDFADKDRLDQRGVGAVAAGAATMDTDEVFGFSPSVSVFGT